MEKISLKNLNSLGIEKLSKESLKNVTGGEILCPHGFILCGDTCYPDGDGFDCSQSENDEHKAATDACKDKSDGSSCTIPQKPGRTGICKHWLTGPLICSF